MVEQDYRPSPTITSDDNAIQNVEMYVFHIEYEKQHICCKIFQKVKEKESNATLDAFIFATNVIDGIFTGGKKRIASNKFDSTILWNIIYFSIHHVCKYS